jgi:hypothetical protein
VRLSPTNKKREENKPPALSFEKLEEHEETASEIIASEFSPSKLKRIMKHSDEYVVRYLENLDKEQLRAAEIWISLCSYPDCDKYGQMLEKAMSKDKPPQFSESEPGKEVKKEGVQRQEEATPGLLPLQLKRQTSLDIQEIDSVDPFLLEEMEKARMTHLRPAFASWASSSPKRGNSKSVQAAKGRALLGSLWSRREIHRPRFTEY